MCIVYHLNLILLEFQYNLWNIYFQTMHFSQFVGEEIELLGANPEKKPNAQKKYRL